MTSSANHGRVQPDALFAEDHATGEGGASQEDGTQVLDGLVSVEGKLVVEAGRHAGESAALGAGTCYVGRSSKCALVLRRTAGVSRRHAKIQYADGHYVISDCGSRNGTRVNGERIGDGFVLNHGDMVQISDERMRFSGPSGREEATSLSESLLASDEPTGSVAGTPKRDQTTQRVRRPSKQPLLTSLPHVEPSADTALLPGYGGKPPLPYDDAPYVHQAGTTPLRKGPLLLLGLLLGLLILGGGLFVWDSQVGEGELLAELGELFADEASDDEAEAEAELAVAEPASADALPEPEVAVEPAPAPPQEAPAEPLEAPIEAAEEPPPPAREPLSVRSPGSGRVAKVAATEGQAVRKGELLLTLERPSPSAARKLKALRREERLFAKHARSGNARARQDLEEVRAEMRRLERRTATTKVRAPAAGVVEELLVESGARVRVKTPLLRLTPEG